MPLTKPNQELRRNLKAAAFALDDAAQDLFREAKSHAEPEFLVAMAKIAKLHEHVDRLTMLADEVKAGNNRRKTIWQTNSLCNQRDQVNFVICYLQVKARSILRAEG